MTVVNCHRFNSTSGGYDGGAISILKTDRSLLNVHHVCGQSKYNPNVSGLNVSFTVIEFLDWFLSHLIPIMLEE